MRDYRSEFGKAEMIGRSSYIRFLFSVFLDEIEEEKDVGEASRLLDVVSNGPVRRWGFANTYKRLAKDMAKWLAEKCVVAENGDIVSFKGE